MNHKSKPPRTNEAIPGVEEPADKPLMMGSVRVAPAYKKGSNSRFDYVLVSADGVPFTMLAALPADTTKAPGLKSVGILKPGDKLRGIMFGMAAVPGASVPHTVALSKEGGAILLPEGTPPRGWPPYFKFDSASPMWRAWGVDAFLPAQAIGLEPQAPPPIVAPDVKKEEPRVDVAPPPLAVPPVDAEKPAPGGLPPSPPAKTDPVDVRPGTKEESKPQ